MSTPVKAIHCKLSMLKKVRLTVHVGHMEVTGIIINNNKRMMESGFKDLKGMLRGTHRSAVLQTHSMFTAICEYAWRESWVAIQSFSIAINLRCVQFLISFISGISIAHGK